MVPPLSHDSFIAWESVIKCEETLIRHSYVFPFPCTLSNESSLMTVRGLNWIILQEILSKLRRNPHVGKQHHKLSLYSHIQCQIGCKAIPSGWVHSTSILLYINQVRLIEQNDYISNYILSCAKLCLPCFHSCGLALREHSNLHIAATLHTSWHIYRVSAISLVSFAFHSILHIVWSWFMYRAMVVSLLVLLTCSGLCCSSGQRGLEVAEQYFNNQMESAVFFLFSFFLSFIYFTSFGEKDKADINSLRWSAPVGLEPAYTSIWVACFTTVLRTPCWLGLSLNPMGPAFSNNAGDVSDIALFLTVPR